MRCPSTAASSILRVTLQLVRAEAAMESSENSWDELLKATRAWQLHLDLQTLLQNVCRSAHELLGFEFISLFLQEQQALKEKARWPGESAAELSGRVEIAQSVVGSGRAAFAQKAAATIVCAPLTGSREIMGALYIESRERERRFGEKEQRYFESFAMQAAACIEHALLYQSAITDPLTRLFCHRHFQQEVEQAVRRAARNERPVTLQLMDLDHFKKLNDTCGHNVGNECLLQVAGILRNTFRCTDIIARFGGDEFEMLLPDTSPDDAVGVAEKVRERIGALTFPQDRRVTATIGVAGCPANARDAQTLFLAADAALYAAKEAGRNRIARAQGAALNPAASDPSRAERLAGTPSPVGGVNVPVEAASANPKVDGHVVVRRIGVGSTAEVLLAIQPGLDREVALKRPLNPNPAPEQEQAFEAEAKLTASLTHPGIVPVFNIGRDQDSRRYYTMKPLTGVTLGNIIEARRKGDMAALNNYSPGRLLDILLRVGETIAFAHKRDVLHLDLTPGNVLVGEFGEVTVIDWASGNSSSSWRNQSGQDGVMLVGSPDFLSPEVFRGGNREAMPASDVFALGALLYYILTDQLPFRRGTMAESVNALMKGEIVAPDTAAPEAGIDPMLSELCMQALSHDPAKRPSAEEFAQRLGLYMRHEVDWSTTRFGVDHPLIESEWLPERGTWRLVNGDHWVCDTWGDAILTWKRPVPGSFRFLVEAWSDYENGELSLIGHRPPPGAPGYRFGSGYFFQFGAEDNTVTKLARDNYDVLVRQCAPLEVGRRYRIELVYHDEEGLIHCAVDGKRVFTYREMFPLQGSQIGFYSYSGSVHFKPLEVSQQNWSVKIPAVRAADRHFQARHFDTALEMYNDVAARVFNRLPGMEARLKSALCQIALGRRKEAQELLKTLRGTLLEPFGLAEEALLNLQHTNPDADPERGLSTMRELFERFPESQARIRIFDAAAAVRLWAQCMTGSRARDLEIQLALRELCVRTFPVPGNSQVTSQVRVAILNTMLGRWREALESQLAFGELLSAAQRRHHEYENVLLVVALANGREDLITADGRGDGVYGGQDWTTGTMLHRVVRKGDPAASVEAVSSWSQLHSRYGVQMLLHYVRKDCVSARAALAQRLALIDFQKEDAVGPYTIGAAIADAEDPVAWEAYLDAYRAGYPLILNMVHAATGRRELHRCNFEAAANSLANTKEDYHHEYYHEVYIQKALLASLGYLKTPSLEEIRKESVRYLAGTRLDLVRMFLEEKPPVPNDLWPHPGWRPEWRLWLGLWLEAKGRKKEAHAVVAPARDRRYGLTHCQPAIEALLSRTG